ncbi:MBL fold metallo-hydrolase [Glaciecola siphonariae]|uniref:MBL fold metallo-hydrolase n=1 Tax=Glaciecola siphonariae TaxID=521012 RepID=A0ABV9LZG9_9ALTE
MSAKSSEHASLMHGHEHADAQDVAQRSEDEHVIEALALELPKAGELCAVDEDIFWLRMPLPFDLDHINLYLIKDGDGYAAIDTGIGTQTTEDIWAAIFDQLGAKITRVIVTHMHPDHIGMAGYLSEKFRAPLYMTMAEYYVARSMVAGGRGASDWQDREYLQRCGMPSQYIEKASQNKGGIQKVVKPIPLGFKRLTEGQILSIGNHQWRVMIGRGHSPEHACLYCESKQILISGDHVLPNISPNIGVYSTEPDANALKLYLATLPQFKDLPIDTKVLPSHKLPFTGLHVRVDELIHHHHAHLARLRDFCQTPRTVEACLGVLFKRKLNPHNMFFAIAEALAHLNYLYFNDELARHINEDGAWIFTSKQVCP